MYKSKIAMIGSTLAHYRILEKIGEGGMGEVYKAEDTRLQRNVALKVLPSAWSRDRDRLKRLDREAKTLAALDHPNVVTIFSLESASMAHDDSGAEQVHFLTMQLVEGRPLRELITSRGMKLNRFLHLAAQLAEAVSAAHQRGIIHRDLKPGNIMIASDDRLTVLDFGLATADLHSNRNETELPDFDLPTQTMTERGVVVGTVPYMAPEQVRGHETDERSDLFSLGIVLYEMATGVRPFRGQSSADLISSILKDEPQPVTDQRPDFPDDLSRMIQRCLEKEPQRRWQSAADLQIEIKKLSVSSPQQSSPIPSIAVLPFVNMSADIENEYFGDGLSEELINALSHLAGLHVVARTSAFRFRGEQIDLREVGRQLNVSTVLEGSVRKAGKQLRITAQLVNVDDGFHLWSGRYDRHLDDVFAIQDDIASTIVEKLRPHLVPVADRPLIRRYTDNREAYNLYLKGRFYWAKRYSGFLRSAIECFEEAIRLDETYALAYCGLADCYTVMGLAGFGIPREMFQKSSQAARRALSLDSQLAEAHASLSYTNGWALLDFDLAAVEIKRALELNPKLSDTRAWYAIFLAVQGRMNESLRQVEEAITLDPLSPNVLAWSALACYYLGRNDDVLKYCQQAFEIDPYLPPAIYGLASVYLARSLPEMALKATDRARESTSILLGLVGRAHAQAGSLDEARDVLRELDQRSQHEYVAPVHVAGIHLALGDTEAAFSCLTKAVEDGNVFLCTENDPLFDSVRDDPRFAELMPQLMPT